MVDDRKHEAKGFRKRRIHWSNLLIVSVLTILITILFVIGCAVIMSGFLSAFCTLLAGVFGLILMFVNRSNGLGALFISLSMFLGGIGVTYPLFQMMIDFLKSFKVFIQESFKWLNNKRKEAIK